MCRLILGDNGFRAFAEYSAGGRVDFIFILFLACIEFELIDRGAVVQIQFFFGESHVGNRKTGVRQSNFFGFVRGDFGSRKFMRAVLRHNFDFLFHNGAVRGFNPVFIFGAVGDKFHFIHELSVFKTEFRADDFGCRRVNACVGERKILCILRADCGAFRNGVRRIDGARAQEKQNGEHANDA